MSRKGVIEYRGYRCARSAIGWTASTDAHGYESGTGDGVLTWRRFRELKHAIDASYRTPGIEYSDDKGDDDE